MWLLHTTIACSGQNPIASKKLMLFLRFWMVLVLILATLLLSDANIFKPSCADGKNLVKDLTGDVLGPGQEFDDTGRSQESVAELLQMEVYYEPTPHGDRKQFRTTT
ncbi:unnamed protein product [Leptidea sinapis]|uniref:Uncharacterized protein n=1 Tax=Leptidea sinapis TaxID=189913 RepID=A0A5E4QL55_9NEOP|nr:unnamed protein product [Leptidea sinapis]